MIEIRNVKIEDASELVKIYNYYILNTAITFEEKELSIDEFKERIIKISSKYPYLVLLDNGIIKGYSYSHEFYGREAYRFSNEVTIYIDKDSKGLGYGKMLYNKLEEALKERGIKNLYSCIASPIEKDKYLDNSSEEFHKHLGYKRIGLFTKCGYKFNNWYNMIWMEKFI
ncbi:MAG: GNAT family N-acetyltransferase [Acholeplasmatales bacterium]|nr:GNAT family N-acetyltransferase [Acholeplasmatales bacterium]